MKEKQITGKIIKYAGYLIIIFLLVFFTGDNVLGAADYARLNNFYERGQTVRVKLNTAKESLNFALKNRTEVKVMETGEVKELSSGDYRLVLDRSGAETRYYVQVLAAENRQRAETMREELENQGFSEIVINYEDDLYKVQVGSKASRQDASRLENELIEAGFTGWIGSREDSFSPELNLEHLESDSDQSIISANNLAIEQGIYLEGEYYPGEVEFIQQDNEFSIFQEIEINHLVSARIFQLQQAQNQQSLSSAEISALSVVIRSQFLWDYLHSERGYIEAADYQGISRISDPIFTAVKATGDYFLSYNQELIKGYYHQNSGGITGGSALKSTADSGSDSLTAVEDPYSPEYSWSKTLTEDMINEELLTTIVEMMPALNMVPGNLRDISLTARTPSGRAKTLNVRTDYGSFNISNSDINKLFDRQEFELPSRLFELDVEKSGGRVQEITLEGRGQGSGLGLPLESARVMSEKQYEWQEILEFFFPAADLREIQDIFMEEKLVEARVQRGLNYQEVRHYTVHGTRTYTKLEFDLDSRRLKLTPALAGNSISSGLKDISDLGGEVNALAGINGGFFAGDGRPLGMLILDGEIVTDNLSDLNRTTLLIDDRGNLSIDRYDWQGKFIFGNTEMEISGINRAAGDNEAILINSYFGQSAPRSQQMGVEIVLDDSNEIQGVHRGRLSYPLSVPEEGYVIQARGSKADKLGHLTTGQHVYIEEKITPEPQLEGEIVHAMEAGPGLLKEGNVEITAAEENFQDDIVEGRAPRSAIGITAENKLIMITVDGRQPQRSVGITLDNLAKMLQNFGAQEAMNLDGGATARMLVRGFTMNVPSAERLISNAIIIVPHDSY